MGLVTLTSTNPANERVNDWPEGNSWLMLLTYFNDIVAINNAAGSSAGTVSLVSSGNLSPLFTTSVATPSTTPVISYSLSNAGANTYFGNPTGGATAPAYVSAGALSKVDDTNVTLSLSANAPTSLLQPVAITLGWAGQLSIARGGSGQSTANDALNAFLPSQATHAGKVLTTDGTNTSWVANGSGTVTSVSASGGTTGMSFTGSPITTSGTLTLTGTLGVLNGGTGTATQFTLGSVVFAGASGVYTQDNANFFWDDTNNRLGLGTATPAKTLSVLGEGRVEPVAGVFTDITGATVNTTNSTTTTLQTIPIPTDKVLLIEARVTSRKTGGAGTGTTGDGNGYIRTVKAKNVGGVVTIGTIQSSFTSEDIASFDVTYTVSGTDLLLRVSGSNNNNVTWTTTTLISQ